MTKPFDFNRHSSVFKFIRDDVMELCALLGYKSESMLEANMQRALCDIGFIREAIDNLEKDLTQ